MLTYLINVTDDLMLISIFIGFAFAFVDWFFNDHNKALFRWGIFAGFIIAAVRSYITNTRRIVGSWRIGVWGYLVALTGFIVLMAVFIINSRVFFYREINNKKKNTVELIICILMTVMLDACIFGAFVNVYVYPFKFDTGGNGILSTDYLFRLGGYLTGLLVAFLASVSAYKISTVACSKGYERLVAASCFFVNTVYMVYVFARLMLVLTPRKIVDSIELFNFAAASNNNSEWYAYICFMVLIILSIIIWVGSFTVKEPYATKAEHRKQRVIWRTGRRYTIVMVISLVCTILCATWFVKLNTVVIREAPVEDPILIRDGTGSDSELWVALESVNDGHLHRFGYTTDDGHLVRFIVILKQENTNNYGVGLDACEICGEAGYYENNDGQIVCKKCGVVMNTTTIGMKGGCNPIIIEYDINESYITVPVSEMINNQNRFKK